MSSIEFEGKTPGNKNKKDPSYSIDNIEDKPIEELIEGIRQKIRRIQQPKQSGSRRT